MKSGVGFNREIVHHKMLSWTATKQKSLEMYWPNLLASVKTEEIKVAMRDGHEVDIRFYKPMDDSVQNGLPVFYSMHGGGFNSEDMINRQICHAAGVLVFSIDYRLAPESLVIPTIYNDVEDGLLWTFKNATSRGGDVNRGIYLSETSAGGAMASFLAHRAQSLGIKVSGVVMRQPVFLFAKYELVAKKEWLPRLTSQEENVDSPLFDTTALHAISDIVKFPLSEAQTPDKCPIFASKEQLARMPRTHIGKAPVDPCADEVQLYYDLLKDAGVDVTMKEYAGMPHGFHSHHVLKAARDEMVDTAEVIKTWLKTPTQL